MFCNNCGAKLVDGAMFCNVCGNKIDIDQGSAKDNNQKPRDDRQPLEVDSKSVDNQPIANDNEPGENTQPSDDKQPVEDDDPRTRIYYGDSGKNTDKNTANDSFDNPNSPQIDQPAMSNGTAAVAKKKNDNVLFFSFIGGCALVCLIAFIMMFAFSCNTRSPIEGNWVKSSGETLRFDNNGQFFWDEKFGNYTLENNSFLMLDYRNSSDIGDNDYYTFNMDAMTSSSDYWYVSDDALYISGEKYIKQ